MLVLSRKPNQRTYIRCSCGIEIVVELVAVKGDDCVRLAFDAPREVQIVRDDAVDQKPKE